MARTVKVVFPVSKSAYKRIKRGDAVLTENGVYDLSGNCIELTRPAAARKLPNPLKGIGSTIGFASSLVLNPLKALGDGIELVSSLGSNVQSIFIQHSVNVANVKLDAALDKLEEISKAIEGLKVVDALSWVNAGFSLANCGVSIAGFKMTLDKLNGLGGQLSEFYNRYSKDRSNAIVDRYRTLLLDLKDELGFMNELHREAVFDKPRFVQREQHIEHLLSAVLTFIRRVLQEFQEKSIDRKLGCQIIFTLTPVYSQLMNEFSCWYYYAHGTQPICFEDWCSILDEAVSPEFLRSLREYLSFNVELAGVSPLLKRDAQKLAVENIAQQKNRLLACAESVRSLPLEKFIAIDAQINSSLMDCFSQACGKPVNELLMERVNSGEFYETEDSILIELPGL